MQATEDTAAAALGSGPNPAAPGSRSPLAESLPREQRGHVGLKGPFPGCRDETKGVGGVDVMTKKLGTTGVPRCGVGSRERPSPRQGYNKREPQRLAQGLGEAGEEVTSVGWEKRGSK